MQTSVYLARLLGPVLVLAGLAMILDPQGYVAAATGIVNSPALLLFAAFLGVLGGTAIVLAHNVWAADWRVIITLLGWISIVDSASWILIPRQAAALWTPVLQAENFGLIAGAITLLLGAVLGYFGYFAKTPVGARA